MASCFPPIPMPPSGCGCKPAQQPPQAIDRPHENCDCLAKEPEIIDLITPLYHACGGRLYRLLLATKAAAVFMGDGTSAELRINQLERAIASNTTLRFADNLAGRDSQKGLIPGDVCVVFDATADPTVHEGGATYMWLPSLQWKKMYNMDSPADPANFIKWKGGLAVDGDRLVYVDCPAIIENGGGLAVNPAGDLYVRIQDLIQAGGGLGADENGDFYVKLEDLIKPGGGLATDGDGHMYVRVQDLISTGSGLVITGDGKISFDAGQMSQEPLLALLKTLRLPQWLTGDMDLWVDGASGDDALTDGRGQRATPFKTIQAAVNYACENFNVGDYTLTIHVAGGTYTQNCTLKSYSRVGGRMRIVGEGNVIIAPTGSYGDVIYITADVWQLENLTIRYRSASDLAEFSQGTAIALDGRSQGSLKDVRIELFQTMTAVRDICGVFCVNYSGCDIGDGCSITANLVGGETKMIAVSAYQANITLAQNPGLTNALDINGPFHIVAKCVAQAQIARLGIRMGACKGSATGMRYHVSSMSIIETFGGGEDYFPGSAPGVEDSAAYGIYNG